MVQKRHVSGEGSCLICALPCVASVSVCSGGVFRCFSPRRNSHASKNTEIGFLVQKTPRKRLLRRLNHDVHVSRVPLTVIPRRKIELTVPVSSCDKSLQPVGGVYNVDTSRTICPTALVYSHLNV